MRRLMAAVLAALVTRSPVLGRPDVTATGTAKFRLGHKLTAVVRDDFLSVGLDAGLARKGWRGLDLASDQLMVLVRGLQPLVLRFGGTQSDCLVFEDDVSRFSGTAKCAPVQKHTRPFELSAATWEPLADFTRRLGLPLLFDLNSLLRDTTGRWVDTNARKVILTTLQQRLNIIWQLGNEPNSYLHKFNYSVPPETLGLDFVSLRRLVGVNATLVGPDANRPSVPGQQEDPAVQMPAQQYLARFLTTGAAAVDAVTFHQYYFNGRTATVADFLDLRHFSVLARQIEAVRAAAGGAAIWLTETGSAWGGGAVGLSDAYLAGFLWLDKLGVAARHGVQLVVRQSLYGGHYALLDAHMRPNPDYWLSYLHKLLVGPRVLPVDLSGPDTVRVYCHCGHRHLPRRAVVCFTLNLSGAAQKVRLGGALRSGGQQYVLTPAGGDLKARTALCNGRPLQLRGRHLPAIWPQPLPPATQLTLPGYSMAFHVFRRAAPPSCWQDGPTVTETAHLTSR